MKMHEQEAKTPRAVRVLLVEDDHSVRVSLAQVLASENYDVIQAADSRQALSEFGQQTVDVAILDINLGGEDGWELFESLLKDSKRGQSLPVIVMSAESDRLQHRLASSARACWHKPLDISLVLSSLLQCLSPQATPSSILEGTR
jgi:DNA-binding response OmpR family regulator